MQDLGIKGKIMQYLRLKTQKYAISRLKNAKLFKINA